jgi:DNA-directed RNA polymerase specialized sigma24 family protein
MASKSAAPNKATVIDLSDPVQFNEMATRLLALARRMASVKRWWHQAPDALAKGRTVEDVVSVAMASLFGGSRKWDPVKEPDPWNHVKSVISSELSNLVTSLENRRTTRGVDDELVANTETPREALLRKEEQAARRQRAYSLLIEQIGDDDQLVKLHDLIVTEDLHKPQELALRMNITVTEANNLKKRFWRACKKVLAVLKKENGQ